MRLSDKLFRVQVSHVTHELTDNDVKPESKEYDNGTNNNCEPHLVNLSLLNTLLPNVELE